MLQILALGKSCWEARKRKRKTKNGQMKAAFQELAYSSICAMAPALNQAISALIADSAGVEGGGGAGGGGD